MAHGGEHELDFAHQEFSARKDAEIAEGRRNRMQRGPLAFIPRLFSGPQTADLLTSTPLPQNHRPGPLFFPHLIPTGEGWGGGNKPSSTADLSLDQPH
jgi:hypothetical protein